MMARIEDLARDQRACLADLCGFHDWSHDIERDTGRQFRILPRPTYPSRSLACGKDSARLVTRWQVVIHMVGSPMAPSASAAGRWTGGVEITGTPGRCFDGWHRQPEFARHARHADVHCDRLDTCHQRSRGSGSMTGDCSPSPSVGVARATMRRTPSGRGRCNSIASANGAVIHRSHSSLVWKTTGMARGW